MSVDLKYVVEDITTQLLTYTVIRVYRSNTLGGTYSVVDTVTLVADTFYYSLLDTGGDLNKWYKYSFYNPTGPVESDLSAPYRVDGVTRLRARQSALSKYGCGIVVVNTGTDNDKITTIDYRVKTSLFRTDRGKGTWLLPTTGSNQEKPRIASTTDPTLGTMTVLPAWAVAFANGDEVEWHWLADPTVWNDALNRGLTRYYYADRVPLNGVAGDEEYDLSKIPWIIDKDQISDVTWYPTSSKDVEQSYASDGRWWKTRMDRDKVVLVIYPPVSSTVTLYLHTARPMPALYTDASAAPAVCVEELVAALTYDEVLAYLSRPGRGSVEERKTWKRQRLDHAPELRRLLWKHRPKLRYGRPRLPSPPVVPRPFQAR